MKNLASCPGTFIFASGIRFFHAGLELGYAHDVGHEKCSFPFHAGHEPEIAILMLGMKTAHFRFMLGMNRK